MPTSYARAPGVVPRRSFNSRVHQERKDEESAQEKTENTQAPVTNDRKPGSP